MRSQTLVGALLLFALALSPNFWGVLAQEDSSEHFSIEAQPNQRPDFKIIPLDNLNDVFDRKIMVFGIPVFAYSGISNSDLVLTANVVAQWLDNDEDGTVDHKKMLAEMANCNAYLYIVENQGQVDSYKRPENTRGKSLDAVSINRDWYTKEGPSGRADGIMEEPFHMITSSGYARLYPNVFGTRKGTELSKALDVARGGQFDEVPDEYPEEAWFTYNDKTCRYGCMGAEYIYWGMISLLGVNSNRGDAIAREWKLYTPKLFKKTDTKLFALLTNPEYKFPTKSPDGTYGN